VPVGTAIPANNRFVSFTATAAQAEAALATSPRDFDKSGRHVAAPASAVSVPANLAGIVCAAPAQSGVQTSPCSDYHDLPQPLPHPLTYAPCGYRPAQIWGAYGLDQALSSGYHGRGATVAVVTPSPHRRS
jgi:subtilase family serine protease